MNSVTNIVKQEWTLPTSTFTWHTMEVRTTPPPKLGVISVGMWTLRPTGSGLHKIQRKFTKCYYMMLRLVCKKGLLLLAFPTYVTMKSQWYVTHILTPRFDHLSDYRTAFFFCSKTVQHSHSKQFYALFRRHFWWQQRNFCFHIHHTWTHAIFAYVAC